MQYFKFSQVICFAQRQVFQVQNGGWSVLRCKLFVLLRKISRTVSLPMALLLVLVIRLLRPWVVIRLGQIPSDRIGHFGADTEIYLCEKDAGINTSHQNCIDIWYYNRIVCNKQLKKMWDRALYVGPVWMTEPMDWVNRLLPGGKVHIIPKGRGGRDVHNLLECFSPHLSFLPEEEIQGQASLKALGVSEGSPFVCFHTRTSTYLDAMYPERNWRYHNYRNSNIHNYVLAIEELSKRGYYAIRMGAIEREALRVSNPKIIDYAINQRSDFLDIYLGAKCTFFISSGTGIDAIPDIFRRPIMFANYAPFERVHTWNANHLFIPKKYWLCTEHRFMHFREILESGAGRFLLSQQFEKRGIELIENTPEEILALALEMDSRLKGRWQTTEEDETLQRCFWALFPKSELHGEIKSRIGAEFLRQYRDWLW